MINLEDIMGQAPIAKHVPPANLLEPGIYYDLPSSEYHALPYVSSTLLKNYASLPSTCMVPFCPGDDANVGSAIHCWSLQGQTGLDAECFMLPPECEGKSAKALQTE